MLNRIFKWGGLKNEYNRKIRRSKSQIRYTQKCATKKSSKAQDNKENSFIAQEDRSSQGHRFQSARLKT